MDRNTTTPAPLMNRAQTDMLKGLAIITIFLYHYMEKLYGQQNLIQWVFDASCLRNFVYTIDMGRVGPIALGFSYFGYIGVSAFFILSGYGLAVSRLNNEGAPWKGFFIRRVLRILPLYYLSILIFSPILAISFDLPSNRVWETVLYKILFIHSFNPDTIGYLNTSLWFVGVLAWLYACFPLVYFIAKKYPHMTLAAGIALAYASSSLIASSWLGKTNYTFAMGGFPLAKLGEFAAGIWIALMLQRYPQKAGTAICHPIAFALSAGMFALGIGGLIYQSLYPLHPLLLALPLMHAATLAYTFMGQAAEKVSSPVRFTGRHAFALFILHEPLLLLAKPWLKMLPMPFLSGVLIVLPLLVLLSAAVDHALGRAMRLKS